MEEVAVVFICVAAVGVETLIIIFLQLITSDMSRLTDSQTEEVASRSATPKIIITGIFTVRLRHFQTF